MQKYFNPLILVALLAVCGSCKQLIVMDAVVDQKSLMDAAENPAKKLIIYNDLREKRVRLFNCLVKDVVQSTNIDYDFCIIVDVQTKKGMVECYIYSCDVKTIARLVKGRSMIDVTGDFSRLISLVGDFYAMIEIVKASVSIRG